MWLKIKYKPVTLFSLKDSRATSMGGKSLIAPSPYSIKMAIINSFIQLYSVKELEENFDWIKELDVKVKLPNDIVINNCFIKIQKLKRNDSKKEGDDSIFQSTVAFREFIYFDGDIELAFKIDNLLESSIKKLKRVLLHINYFGKRGCFFQPIINNNSFFEQSQELGDGFGVELAQTRYLSSIICQMDDFGPKVKSFDNINNYSKSSTDRLSASYCFPYELSSSSKSYYHFRKINAL